MKTIYLIGCIINVLAAIANAFFFVAAPHSSMSYLSAVAVAFNLCVAHLLYRAWESRL